MRRVIISFAVALLLLVGTITAAAPADAVTAVTPTTTGCLTTQLKLAGPVPGDKDPNGNPISISPGPKGMFVPVIMVHGWNGDPSNFTGKIRFTSNKVGTVVTRDSLVGQLQDMVGSAVYTFDYHRYSDRWVSDSHIGAALANAIDCLYKASGQKVILVAHSMGGLAIEQTFSKSIRGYQTRASEISTVVTFGTPFKGSVLDSMAHHGGIDASVAGVLGGNAFVTVATAILAACGRVSTVNADTICTSIKPLVPVTTFFSDAANALQYGSKQIRALPSMPDSIHLVQLAGNTDFGTRTSWFRDNDTEKSTVHLGDTVVTEGSAIPSPSKENSQVTCNYTLNPLRLATDGIRADFGVVAANDARGTTNPLFDSKIPCSHTNLPDDIELTNAALSAVYSDINARVQAALTTIAENAVIPSGVCYDGPQTLVNGRAIIPDSMGYGETHLDTQWPTADDAKAKLPALIADGRSQMVEQYRGAIAVKVFCSASGAGGGASYIILYTNAMKPIGLIDFDSLHTAYGFAQPYPKDTTFTNGELHTQVTWQDGYVTTGPDPFGDCPVTTVQLDYSVTQTATLSPGPETTIQGDPTCG